MIQPQEEGTLLVTGEYACFRHKHLSDVVTYDVMSPMYASWLLNEANLYFGAKWKLLSITCLEPIKTEWMELEVNGDVLPAIVLRDVAYLVDARQRTKTNTRPARASQSSIEVDLGLPHFRGTSSWVTRDQRPRSKLQGSGVIDLGWMQYDEVNTRRRFFRCIMRDGQIDLDVNHLLLVS